VSTNGSWLVPEKWTPTEYARGFVELVSQHGPAELGFECSEVLLLACLLQSRFECVGPRFKALDGCQGFPDCSGDRSLLLLVRVLHKGQVGVVPVFDGHALSFVRCGSPRAMVMINTRLVLSGTPWYSGRLLIVSSLRSARVQSSVGKRKLICLRMV